jgi:Xaa-Pro dipeptidase
MPVFEKAEYLERNAKVKARMAEKGIDVLIATHPANMNYLTGYDGWSFYVHQCVVVAADAEEPIWIGRGVDEAGARLTTFLEPENIHAYDDDYVDATDKHCMHYMADVLKERGWDRGNIGVEMDAYYFTARGYLELVAKLPRANIVDGYPLVNWVRIVKSPAEIAFMRAAGKIVSHAMHTGIEVIEPGVRECDAIAKVYHAQISGTPEFWGDYTAAVPQTPTGAKTAAAHLTWTGDPYQADSVTYLELGGCHQRYHSSLARTIYLGAPPPEMTDVAAVTADGLEAALDAARAGVTCQDVEAAWRAVITKAGHEKRSRIGYSIGVNYPPNWGEHTASLRQGDMTVLKPNMCFHMILGMWMEGWGYVLSETFRVTEDGAPETFAEVERKLFVKD